MNVLAAYPRSGHHFLTSLLLERLGVADAPQPEQMREDGPRLCLRDHVPFVKCGALQGGDLKYGFVRTHGAPLDWYGSKVLLMREPGPVAASWARYFGLSPEQAQTALMHGTPGKGWLGPPTDWHGFNQVWLDAGALPVWYENLLDDPRPEVDRILEHFKAKGSA